MTISSFKRRISELAGDGWQKDCVKRAKALLDKKNQKPKPKAPARCGGVDDEDDGEKSGDGGTDIDVSKGAAAEAASSLPAEGESSLPSGSQTLFFLAGAPSLPPTLTLPDSLSTRTDGGKRSAPSAQLGFAKKSKPPTLSQPKLSFGVLVQTTNR